MKAYTNKLRRICKAGCLYSEINHGYKSAKKAFRTVSKKLTKEIE